MFSSVDYTYTHANAAIAPSNLYSFVKKTCRKKVNDFINLQLV